MMCPRRPEFGQPAPWFVADSSAHAAFHLDSAAGRIVVLAFFPTSRDSRIKPLLEWAEISPDLFDPSKCVLFGVTTDFGDRERQLATGQGIIFFWDFDREISCQYGVTTRESVSEFAPCVFVLDSRLRVAAVIPASGEPADTIATVRDAVIRLQAADDSITTLMTAPVLIVPRIFEVSLCQALIEYYLQHGGQESGFMRERDGKTVLVEDPGFKRRRDQEISDPRLRGACMHRIHDRLLPEIAKAFQFRATRIERYIVASYDSAFGQGRRT